MSELSQHWFGSLLVTGYHDLFIAPGLFICDLVMIVYNP